MPTWWRSEKGYVEEAGVLGSGRAAWGSCGGAGGAVGEGRGGAGRHIGVGG